MHRIVYAQWIRKTGVFGLPYAVLKLRTAHVDERNWRRLRDRRRRYGEPFSLREMMCFDPRANA